jgi:hypothetical protein
MRERLFDGELHTIHFDIKLTNGFRLYVPQAGANVSSI